MFYISRQLNEYVYEVIDDKDGVAELYTYSQLIDFTEQGISIVGVYDDTIVPYSGKKNTPYIGTKRNDIQAPIGVMCKYRVRYKKSTKVITKKFAYDEKNNRLKDSYFSYNYRLNADGKILCYDSNFNYVGELAFIGTTEFILTPEYIAKWGYPVEKIIRNCNNLLKKRIDSNQYVKDKYIFNEDYQVYVNNSLHELDCDYNYNILSLDFIDSSCYSSIVTDDNLYNLIKLTHSIGCKTVEFNSVVPVKRVIKSSGISYQFINQQGVVTSIDLEKIISSLQSNKKIYSKYCSIEDDKLIVRSLDGVVEYSIDAIYKVYKNIVSNESKKIETKMKLAGFGGDCKINEKGELIRFSSGSEVVTIPSEVKVITKNSLVLQSSNRVLVVKSNVVKVSSNSIFTASSDLTVKTDIKNYNILKQLVKALFSSCRSVKFSIDYCNDNFVELYTAYRIVTATSSTTGYLSNLGMSDDKEYFNDDTIKRILFIIVEKELGNFKWLNEKPKLIVSRGKLPMRYDDLSIAIHSSYSKYYSKYFIYYSIIKELLKYLSSSNKQMYINHLGETRELLDRQEKEFMQRIGQDYYYSGYLCYK